jgi:hypothetical protein
MSSGAAAILRSRRGLRTSAERIHPYDAGKRLQIFGRSIQRQRVDSDQDRNVASSSLQEMRDMQARFRLATRCDRILQIQDQCIGAGVHCLLHLVRSIARNEHQRT